MEPAGFFFKIRYIEQRGRSDTVSGGKSAILMRANERCELFNKL